jgi:hypothetical protein
MRTSSRLVYVLFACSWAWLGCDHSDDPDLSYSSINYGEGFAPLPFAVGVTNQGRAEGRIDRADARVLSMTPIPGPGLEMQSAEDFRYRLFLFGDEHAGDSARPLPPGAAVRLPADKTTDVWCALEWSLPEDAPPMLAACSVKFLLSYKGEVLVETPTQAVIVQSKPGILEKMTATRADNAEQAAKTVEILSSVQGKPSEGLRQLLNHLRSRQK